MTTRFRVVDHAATGHRYRTVRLPGQNPQYMSAAQAALRSQLTGEQSNPSKDNFSNPAMNPTPGGGSDGASAVAAMAGFPGKPAWLGTHKNRYGISVPNIYNPIGPGTRLGSVLQQSDAGREFASLMNQRRGGSDVGSYGNLFGVGARLSGRGTAGEWASQGYPTGEGKSLADLASNVSSAYDTLQVDRAQYEVLQAAGYFARHPGEGAAADRGIAMDEANLTWAQSVFRRAVWERSRPARDVASKWAGTIAGVVGSVLDPNPDWIISPVGPGGDYPTATPEQSGGHAMSSALLQDTLAEAWRRMKQQAHSPAGSVAGGGGGTSVAPERLFLHGMKHPYDWVATGRAGS